MDRFVPREVYEIVPGGLRVAYGIWDNLTQQRHLQSMSWVSKYACKQYIKRFQEVIE